MRSVYERHVAEATETERRLRQGTDRIVVGKFGAVAKLLWPDKTAAHLAAIAGRDERAAWRWMSGEHEPPISIVEAVIHETFKR